MTESTQLPEEDEISLMQNIAENLRLLVIGHFMVCQLALAWMFWLMWRWCLDAKRATSLMECITTITSSVSCQFGLIMSANRPSTVGP
jgi:hypothetical protein